METNDVVDALGTELRSFDQVVYLYQPEEVDTDFFIGEAILIAAGVVLLQTFMDGVIESLKPTVKRVGESLGERMADGLARLFNTEPDAGEIEQLDFTLDALFDLMETTPPGDYANASASVRGEMASAIVDHGGDEDEAHLVATHVEAGIARLLVRDEGVR